MNAEILATEYNSIRSDFARDQLLDLCIDKIGVQTGPFGSQLHKEDYVKHGTPIITVEHLGDNRILHQNTPYVSNADKERLSKYHLQTGDIVFSRVGSVDRRALVRESEDGWLFSGRCLRVRVDNKKIDPVYLSYFFGLENFKQYIRSIAVGATMPSINTKILSDVPIYYPKIEEQREIANVLYTIDEKIELNRQINQTLEEMAQAIFKSWFVDFEPVKAKIEAKANGQDPERAAMCAISGKIDADLGQLSPDQLAKLRTTAALFPDELIESELGPIPKGWKAGSIGNVAAAKGGYAYKSKIFIEVGHPVVKIKNIVGDGTVNLDGCQCIDADQAQATSRFNLSDGDLLMAMTGATVGKVGLVVLSGRTAYLNQRVAKFESSEFGPGISWFLFCAFQRESIFEQVVGTAQGSAQPNISSKGIESTRLVVPSNECLREFIAKAEPLFFKWMSNQNEIKNLASIRDSLLPKLLSGEIKLESAPISS